MRAPSFVLTKTFVQWNGNQSTRDRICSYHSAKCSTRAQYLSPLLDAARTKLQPLGLTVSSLTWEKAVLTAFVTKLEGDATADDCASASVELTAMLDEDDYFRDRQYTLEVSTPGTSESLDSPRAFDAFKGFPVRVIKRDGEEEPPVVYGRLGKVDNEFVFLNVKGRPIKMPRETVKDITLCTASDVSQLSL